VNLSSFKGCVILTVEKRMTAMHALALVLTVSGGAWAADWAAFVRPDCTVVLSRGGQEIGTLEPGLFQKEWRGAGPGAPRPAPVTEPRRTVVRAPDGQEVDCELRAEVVGTGVVLHYRLVPKQAIELNSLHVSFDLPEHIVRGASFSADGKPGSFPAERGATHLYGSEPTRALALSWADGARLEFSSAEPVPMLVQDNRQWGPNFCVRIGPQMTPPRLWPAAEAWTVDLTVTAVGGMSLSIDEPVTLEAGEEWLPLAVALDIEPGSALDFSGLRPTAMPAGKQGRVISTPTGQFAFAEAPTVPRRFYGVNLCFTAQYLAPEQAEALAERLMRLGYNAVRFHHYESVLAERSGGTSTKAKADVFDQLDHLAAALKQRGIYMTTDLFVSRQVFAAEIWPGATGNVAMDEFKMLVPVNEAAFANFAAWTRTFLEHVNPYTGLRYADEPALAWLSLINEGNVGNFIGSCSERARADWQRAWSAWLLRTYGTAAAVGVAWGKAVEGELSADTAVLPKSFTEDSVSGRDFAAFLADTELALFRRVKTLLRDELKCQALLTNMNGWSNTAQSQRVRLECDYVDDHFYVDHPQFIEQPWRLPSRCANTSPVAVGAPGGRNLAFTRLLDKPFTVSEYNYSGPGRYRGVGGILTGCMAALQEWSVVWRFAYSHNRENLFKASGAGYFDLATDPLNQAAERATLCLFLRGDLSPVGRTVAVTMDPAELARRQGRQGSIVPPWSGLVTVAKVGLFLGARDTAVPADLTLPTSDSSPLGTAPVAAAPYAEAAGAAIVQALKERAWLGADNSTDLGARRAQSASGQFTLDGPADTMILDTPCTAGCFAPAGKTVETAAARFAIRDTDATVWVSSLDGQPVATSRRLLITHLTDLQNTGVKYADRARTTLLAWGSTPHLLRNGAATVTLKRGASKAEAWGLSTSGRRLAALPVRASGQEVVLELAVKSDAGARMIYEVLLE
jgi:hypothetical protein